MRIGKGIISRDYALFVCIAKWTNREERGYLKVVIVQIESVSDILIPSSRPYTV